MSQTGRLTTVGRPPLVQSAMILGTANLRLQPEGADHGHQHFHYRSSALEQGEARRPKDPIQTKGDMGDSHKTPHRKSLSRSRLFNLAIDSKLRACDLMQLRVRDVCHGHSMASRAFILQQKTSRPVQSEITEPARTAVSAWISHLNLKSEDYLFPSRIHASPHLSTRQYARIVDSWVHQLGLDPANYGTHTLRADEGDINLPADKESAGSPVAARS
jgi:integrase